MAKITMVLKPTLLTADQTCPMIDIYLGVTPPVPLTKHLWGS
jgi:hypothetical protein